MPTREFHQQRGHKKRAHPTRLVLYDLLGIYPGKPPKFSKNFLAGAGSARAAVEGYVSPVGRNPRRALRRMGIFVAISEHHLAFATWCNVLSRIAPTWATHEANMKTTKHLKIHGLVQGVYYRESLRREAGARGVAGWVRNRRDGSVEAMLHGEEMAVEALIAWCWAGVGRARVERVEIEAGQGEFVDFERLDTV